jgi:hypothetical protein
MANFFAIPAKFVSNYGTFRLSARYAVWFKCSSSKQTASGNRTHLILNRETGQNLEKKNQKVKCRLSNKTVYRICDLLRLIKTVKVTRIGNPFQA